MKLKSVSILLTGGILFNNINLNSYASILSDDTRYEIFIENNITINDILEEDKTNIKIEGNTLVNSIGTMAPTSNNGVVKDNSFSFIYDNKDVRVYFENSTIKENTTYTIFANITKNTLTRIDSGNTDNVMKFNINNYNFVDRGCIWIKKGQTGLFSKTITTGAQNTLPYLETGPNAIYEVGGEFEIKDIMVVEGDYSNINLDYFKGIQSSFENQLITQEMVDSGKEKAENLGKYKVELKSTGKNKFNGKLELGSIDPVGNNIPSDTSYRSVDYIDVRNVNSLVSNHNLNYFWYDSNKNIIGEIMLGVKSNTVVKKPYGANYLRVYRGSLVSDLQLEENSSFTEYEPYKEFIKTFYLNSPLRKWDKIENISGQLTHVKNTQEISLTGEENWYFVKEDLENGFTMFGTDIENKAPNALYNILSDKLITSVSDESGKEFLRIGNYGNSIFINISNSTLSTVDNNGFKNWLKANPIKVLYKTLNPEYEKIEADLSVQLFEGTTHISNNSNISTSMEVTVDRALNRAVEYTILAKTNPTTGNLSMARYWTNLAKESIKKDTIQNEINSITDIEDLQLERKTVTSNVDVYIESENMLSMSLDTNFIIFDNYSGVEDIEKTNAINITINSSLPYQINAYLPNRIENADKSSTIDLSVLKIKESNKSNYQTFIDNTSKVTLKDNCIEGNAINHRIDLKLEGSLAHKTDVYKTVIKLEVEQK